MCFETAFAKTLVNELGYVDDPDDRGGETYNGISRRYWPGWPGWPLIDILKSQGRPYSLDPKLADLVREFYRVNFWDRLGGDSLCLMSPPIACKLFDVGVNMDVPDAAKILQMSLNLLNRNQDLYKDLLEDGKIGPKTLTSMRTHLKSDPWELLMYTISIFQGCHYVADMRKNPTQEKYARGQMKRTAMLVKAL